MSCARRLAGKLKEEKDKEGRFKEVTEGGILRWKREIGTRLLSMVPRRDSQKTNGGRAPKVLDPFAGGGAIPLEAMRLGCEVTAADLNPVAWFILKCTLAYPQELAGQKRPLPDFILGDAKFMEEFLAKVHGLKGAKLRKTLDRLGHRAKEGDAHQEELDFEDAAKAAAAAGLSLEATSAGTSARGAARFSPKRARSWLASIPPTPIGSH